MSTRSDLPNVLCVGRLYCDLIFTDLPRMPTAGTEVFAGGVGFHAGGGSAITAGHLCALGHRTSLAAHLPKAAFGDTVMAELSAVGVGLDLCAETDADVDPQMTVALVQGGERAFVTHRTGPAFPAFRTQDIAHLDIRHIHVGEATTLLENPSLVSVAQELGATLSLDCSWDDNISSKGLLKVLPHVDVFLPNEAETGLLRKLGMAEPFSKLTVIKQGQDGATAVTDDGAVHVPAMAADVVDTTGAGDAFNAAFLSAWLADKPIKACLKFGNAKAAEAISFRGGLGGVSRDMSGLGSASKAG